MNTPGLNYFIARSKNPLYGNWLLNFVLSRVIPFNAPHQLKVTDASPGKIKVVLPYKTKNLNHVKSMHACALATLCEYTTGLALVSIISEKDYRIILKNINVEYHYRAMTAVYADFTIEKEFIENVILLPLTTSDSVIHEFEVKVFDMNNNHICTGIINWQIKSWKKVKN